MNALSGPGVGGSGRQQLGKHPCKYCNISPEAYVFFVRNQGRQHVIVGPPTAETVFAYEDGEPQGLHLGQDSCLGAAGSVLATAQLAADPSSAVAAPADHADQYIDDADVSFAMVSEGSYTETFQQSVANLEKNLQSTVDRERTGVGGLSGMMVGRVDYLGVRMDEVSLIPGPRDRRKRVKGEGNGQETRPKGTK